MTSPTGDGAALLRAVCDDPDDDTARLAYADWLDENASGQSDRARAEFVRIQVAEAAKPVTWLNNRPWTKREHELYKAHQHTWRAELPTYPGLGIHSGNDYGFGYERGFPFELYAKSVRSYLKAAPALFTRVPITKVRFAAFTERTAVELARSPWLGRVRFLDQYNGIGADTLAAIGTSPHVGNLREVLLDGGITAADLWPFLANPALTGLRKFRVSRLSRIGSGIVEALVGSSSAGAFEEVWLSSCGIGPDAAADLPALMRLPNLRNVNLGSNRIGDEGMIAVAGTTPAPPIPGVRRKVQLELDGATERGVAAFLAGPFLRDSDWTLILGTKNDLPDELKAKLKAAFGDRVVV